MWATWFEDEPFSASAVSDLTTAFLLTALFVLMDMAGGLVCVEVILVVSVYLSYMLGGWRQWAIPKIWGYLGVGGARTRAVVLRKDG